MTSDLCTEDVVVRITPPQIITSQTIMSSGAAGAAGARVAASSAAVELGRRLLLAARAGDTQLVLELMAKGAPFTTDWVRTALTLARPQLGTSPLHLAAAHAHADTCACAALTLARPQLGTSPLHLAAAHAHADTCAVLLRAGVSRDARTKVERTPLHLAASGGHAAVARVLLQAGAAVDVRDMLRMTPLHWAVQRGHAAAAGELLRAGADPAALSKFHKTPLALAAELRRDDLLRLMDDAVKEREAARSVSALVNEQMAEATPIEPQIQTFDAVQRIQDVKPAKPKEKIIKTESNKNESSAAAALLRSHGITLLPTDDGSTVLSALQSGRTVVLSDAGKLMLKESETSPSTVSKAPSAHGKGVLLTATPVKSPPKPGVKIFTLNNKLGLAVPVENKIPVKKIINPQDMQVKFVQLPPDAKIISPSKLIPMKAKNRVTTRTPVTSLGTQRPAVKIIMNKSNFNRLLATATRAPEPPAAEVTATTSEPETTATEGAALEGDQSDSPGVLRAQLAAAQRALTAMRKELKSTRARLAHYERLQSL